MLPTSGKVFISVTNRSKDHVADLARRLERMGFELLATKGTALRLEEAGVRVQTLMKIQEGRPNVLDYMIDGNLHLVINTPSGKGARTDEGRIRAAAVSHGIPCITTLEGADGRRRRDGGPAPTRNDRPGRAGPLSIQIESVHFSLRFRKLFEPKDAQDRLPSPGHCPRCSIQVDVRE